MITQLMASDKIKTFQEALDLHPASYGGAQEGAQAVTQEMSERTIKKDGTQARRKRDEEQTLENLEEFIKENI